MDLENVSSILIIGMAGNLAKITAKEIHGKNPNIKIIGVDSRKVPRSLSKLNVKFHQINYTRSHFERLFREHKFDVVLFLGRYAHVGLNILSMLTDSLDTKISGIKNIFDLCVKFKVKRIVVLSSFHVYGALPGNPLFLLEDTPLKADFKYPDIRDVVEMDKMARLWVDKHKAVETVILRPCSIVGPHIQNAITKYLKTPYAPVPMDFNPNFQFLHETDMADIIVKAIDKLPPDTYNVAPDEYVTIRDAMKIVGNPTLPVPLFLIEPMAKILKKTLFKIPEYFISYLKFPCIIDNSNLHKALGDLNFRYNTKETLKNLK